MYETNQEAKRLIERKVQEVIDKGDISPSEMCCVKDAYEALYYMTAAETMETSKSYGNSYGNSYGDSYGNSRSMSDWEESMRRGRGANGQFVSREGGRSYHSVNDRIVANLERELDYAQSEFERKRIMDEIRRLREMKD